MFIIFLVWPTILACIPSISPDNLTTSSTSTTTSSTSTSTSTTTTTKSCPVNWLLFNNFCYFFSTTKITWTQAEANCVGMGAHLASIHSAAENNFIVMQLTTGATVLYPNGLVAIGVMRPLAPPPPPYNFANVDGTPFDYTNWFTGQPDNSAGAGLNEACVQLFSDNLNTGQTIGTWNDILCTMTTMTWVCKM